MIRLKNIKIRENICDEEVFKIALSKNRLKESDVKDWYIFKKSIDARDKNDVHFVYSIDVELNNKKMESKFDKVEKYKFEMPVINRKSILKPVIVGAGPAGLFAGIMLIDSGFKPIILEQGKDVDSRIIDVENLKNNRVVNKFSNVQFGEGGAGTFSDGKLNTGNTSKYSHFVLEQFVKFGAPKEILYTAKPHIGTDNLVKIVKNMRNYIIQNGGEVHFNEKANDFEFENGKLKAVIGKNRYETDSVILAIGHSARDTVKKLYELGLNIEPKNFAVGVRIEHLQKNINLAQYGDKTKLKLPSADYKLVYHTSKDRAVYTFCMCPGGVVVASNSEENSVVTNGMSYFARNGENANSALLVNVSTEDFDSSDPFGGMKFQEEIEKKAFILGGENYNAPIQRVEDFINNIKTTKIGEVKPSYKPGVTFSNLNELFPEFINGSLKEAIINLDKKLNGFASNDAIMTGAETRTSSAVKIVRDKETLMSNVLGIYPCGEGAGYAGGIMTAAIDGIKCAIKIIEKE